MFEEGGGASMRRRVGHGGVAPRWGCPAVAAVCREGPSHQERGDPVDGHTAILLPILPRLARSLRLAAGRGVQWSGKLGEATRGGEGAFSRTRSPGLFSHVSPPPLSRAPSADSLLPRSLPFHSPSPLNPSLISPYSNLPMPLAVGVCIRGVIGAERDSVWGGLLTGKRGR